MSGTAAEAKQLAKEIQKGLSLMGNNRKMALPTHSTVELIEELEEKVAKLVSTLDALAD